MQQIDQPAHARRKALGTQQIDGVGGHAHEIAHGAVGIAAGVVFPCAGEDAARDTLIDGFPVPHGHGQVVDDAAFFAVQAECAGFHLRRADVPVGNDMNAEGSEFLFGIGIGKRGPFQIDLCARIGHLRAESECIDRGRYAVNRIVRDVADSIIVCHGAGDCAENKLGFIDA